jgi:hypothetical protein
MGSKSEMMWAVLLHLGFNMWKEENADYTDEDPEFINASPKLLCNKNLWDELTEVMSQKGLDTLIIDLGEGVKYESHPELAVKGSWTKSQLQKELDRLHAMGIKTIPKLNFSTCHDEWLGEYSKCVSTAKYYEVCKDLINEVIDLFEDPEYFHLGMDEETYKHQRHHNIAIVRNGNAWWKDFYYLVDIVEKRNVRSWIWSDYIWSNKETFLKKMPRSVLQSNWYYGRSFSLGKNKNDEYIEAYITLEEHGYDQVPTGSNWSCQENFERTVRFCKDVISPSKLKGFLQAPWVPTVLQRKYYLYHALYLAEQAKKEYYE